MRAIFAFTFIFGTLLPAFGVLPGQSGSYMGKATVTYTDLGAAKSVTYKTSVILRIEPNGNADFSSPDINVKMVVESGPYHGIGYYQDGSRIGNMPLHIGTNGSLKGTFHFVSPGQNEMTEAKMSLKKQLPTN